MLLCTVAAFAQTIYSENMGATSSGNPSVSTYTGWQNTTITYSGTASARVSNSSPTPTFSGGVNIFFSSNSTQNFIISGINTSAYASADLVLTFALRQDGSTPAPPASNLVLEASTNGTDFNAITYSRTSASNNAYETITVGGGLIPSSATLSLRFTQNGSVASRLDDVKIAAVSASCTLSLGTASTACVASTLSTTDATTITIPFTGGGNATYNLSADFGTISGDSPSTVAEGNVIITVAEGTTVTLTATGGTCNISKTVAAPSCKPINTLPFADSFDYPVGNSLGSSQKWSTVNSGDNVTVIAGNLNYTGIVPAGNSVSFSGTGAEAYAPFTATTTGMVYTSFLMNVTDMTNITTDETQAYVMGLLEGTSTSSYNVRLYTKKVGTQYQLGLDTAGNTTTNLTTSSYNVGDVILVILGFDYSDNTYKLWINPTVSTFSTGSTPTLSKTATTAPVSFGGFILRQDDANNTPSITIDELRIGTALSDILSTKSFNEISGLKLFPNPLSGNVLNVTSNSNADKTIAVYDVLGKNVLNAKVTNETVNVSGLNSGVYIVKITEEGKTATRKLVVK